MPSTRHDPDDPDDDEMMVLDELTPARPQQPSSRASGSASRAAAGRRESASATPSSKPTSHRSSHAGPSQPQRKALLSMAVDRWNDKGEEDEEEEEEVEQIEPIEVDEAPRSTRSTRTQSHSSKPPSRASKPPSWASKPASAGPFRPRVIVINSDDDDIETDDRSAVSPPLGAPSPVEYEYVTPTPEPPQRHRLPFVDIPFMDLATMFKYKRGDGVRHPTNASRAALLHRQKNAPPSRFTKPRAAKAQATSLLNDGDYSDDLGGYSQASGDPIQPFEDARLESEQDWELMSRGRSPSILDESRSESSITPRRRTRASGKAREMEPRQTRQGTRGARHHTTESTFSSTYSGNDDIIMIERRSTRRANRSPPPVREPKKRGRPPPGDDDDDDFVMETGSSRWTNRPSPPARQSRKRKTPVSKASWNNESEGEDEISEFDELDEESETEARRTKAPTREILSEHRQACEKCRRGPADDMLAAARKKKAARKGKPLKRVDDGLISDEEQAHMLQGWLTCESCTVSSHWYCLKPNQQRDVLAQVNAADPDAYPRRAIVITETSTYLCVRCAIYPVCFVCAHRHLPTEDHVVDKGKGKATDEANGEPSGMQGSSGTEDAPIVDEGDDEEKTPLPPATGTASLAKGLIKGKPAPLLFRCTRCTQAVHYEHMKSPFPPDQTYTIQELAQEYQESDEGLDWYCHKCREWVWHVDRIIAWRPLPANAVEPERDPDELPRYRDHLPREYLVKWKERGFRHVQWVPHDWILPVAPQKLKNFIEKGPQLDLVTDETLAVRGDEMAAPTIIDLLDEQETERRPHGAEGELEAKWEGHGPAPDVDAEQSVPIMWSTIDRILDVHLRPPKTKGKHGAYVDRRRVVSPGSESGGDDDEAVPLEDGLQPPDDMMISLDRWETMTGREIGPEDADEIAPLVTWVFVKWDDLQYDESCYDTPPPVDSPLYPAFKHALKRYLGARRVNIPILTGRERKERDAMAEGQGEPPSKQPDCIVGGTLMPFQVEGFQWLLYKHWQRKNCILADDMGLGKTIQVCSFLGYLCSEEYQIYPHLVIVPNSTITNWVREFEKWVPHVRVVPFYGGAASRKVISKYEMYHPGKHGQAAGLKAHVILTTYETITGVDFKYFNNVPRWEVVIIDEGQRLKSDSNLIFNRVKQLDSVQCVLLTGTPLNNNLRELFNLLNLLDPETFRHLDDLEERFGDLNETLLEELHELVKPFILRRVKGDVLKLPPKVEIIVPISMTPAQKRQSRLILQKHQEVVNALRNKKKRKGKAPAVEGGGATEGGAGANGVAAGPGGTQASANGTGDDPIVVERFEEEASGGAAGAAGAPAAGATNEPETMEVDEETAPAATAASANGTQ